jgi:hypothetical protein
VHIGIDAVFVDVGDFVVDFSLFLIHFDESLQDKSSEGFCGLPTVLVEPIECSLDHDFRVAWTKWFFAGTHIVIAESVLEIEVEVVVGNLQICIPFYESVRANVFGVGLNNNAIVEMLNEFFDELAEFPSDVAGAILFVILCCYFFQVG